MPAQKKPCSDRRTDPTGRCHPIGEFVRPCGGGSVVRHACPVTVDVEHLRRWTYRRQRLGSTADGAADALRDVIATYSAHPSAPLALHARYAALDAEAFRALATVRLPAMRGSIHLLPADSAHLPFRALPEPAARSARRLRYFGLDEQRYRELRAAGLAAAATPRSAAELRRMTGAGDELTGVLGAMSRGEGSLVRIGAPGLRSNALRYVTADIPPADADEALAWLAGEYLRAFGPARRDDFAWWAGVAAGRAGRALATVTTVELDGGLLLREEDQAAFAAAPPLAGMVDLLPKWDPYTMGYPLDGRGRLAHLDVVGRCYDARGDGLPLVLVDGAAAGTWQIRPGPGVGFEVELFEPATPALRRALDERLAAVARLLA
jgi:hypothetical protein